MTRSNRNAIAEHQIDALLASHPRLQSVKRAVGILRVSDVRGREGEKFASPDDQRDKIERICAAQSLQLVAILEELDVSAFRRSLAKRPGLREAVRMVEAGEVEVVVVAYFDRAFRNLGVQAEALKRIGVANGSILAVDIGQIRTETAAEWFSATILGAVAEMQARQIRDRLRGPRERAVKNGIPPWGIMPFGYARGPDRRVVVVPEAAAVAREAFERREAGASIEEICGFLRERGHPLTFRSVQKMFWNRFYLGELHYGKFSNLQSHQAIIDGRLFRSVQGLRGGPRGRRSDSPNLLARQGVLVCGTCNGKMVSGGQNLRNRPEAPRKRYYDYRCTAILNPGCSRRPYISAVNLDAYVVEYVKRRLAEAQGRWSSDERLLQADAEIAAKEAALNAAVAAFDGIDVVAARTRLLELQAELENAQQRLEALRVAFGTPALANLADWETMTLAEQRAALRIFIRRIVVVPGRGTLAERVTIETFEK